MEKNYLINILGISSIPKLLTFLLTLVSYPILVRGLGADQYGSILYMIATINILEIFIDFGISSAAGKAISEVRANSKAKLKNEVFLWSKLQAIFIVAGLVPMIGGTYYIVQSNLDISNLLVLIIYMGATTLFSAVINFAKSIMQALLSFKSLAVLDGIESISRSIGFIVVGSQFPSIHGFIICTFAYIVFVASIAITILLCAIRKEDSERADKNSFDSKNEKADVMRIKDSIQFLWLRLTTRLYYEGPLIVFGNLLGMEFVGIIGAFRKVIEVLGVPYSIIGNTLMVRIHELYNQGSDSINRVWNLAIRIASTTVFLWGCMFFLSDPLAALLLPGSTMAQEIFPLLTSLVFSSVALSIVAPMSDYLGGLQKRNIFLTIISIAQVPVLFYAGSQLNIIMLTYVYICINITLTLGYILIAKNIFFGRYLPFFDNAIFYFLLIVMASATITSIVTHFIRNFLIESSNYWIADIFTYLLLFIIITFKIKKVKKKYFSTYFFEP